ncbi:ricin-type beta-trefoil lectin domain protein [Streptomyces sp. NPDC088755]|uniref:ricin-type beta-trefoil lectin domain protein n=1 Tax=Streptomyces sp. NPDC088755 TaxID=3365888 RepID=UPI0037F18220
MRDNFLQLLGVLLGDRKNILERAMKDALRHIRRRSLAMVAVGATISAGLAVAAAPAAAGSAAAATAASGPVTLVNTESNQCLDVQAQNPSPGGVVGVWSCNGGVNQKFSFRQNGELRAMSDTLCLTGADSAAVPGTQLRTATCQPAGTPTMSITPKFSHGVGNTLVHSASGLCVTKPATTAPNGSRVTLETCETDAKNQQWTSPGVTPAAPPKALQGVNWSAEGDNFRDDAIVPSGLSAADSYAATYEKAVPLVRQFKQLGSNTVRVGVNAQTLKWGGYRAVLDAALDEDVNVMVGLWSGKSYRHYTNIPKADFDTVWSTLINEYGSDPRFYANVVNEPGDMSTKWQDFVNQFLHTYPQLPRNQVVVAGRGDDRFLTEVCKDKRLSGTIMSYHQYSVFELFHKTVPEWKSAMRSRLGIPSGATKSSCSDRTVVTEFGDWSRSGIDYNGPRDGDMHVSYMYAMTEVIRETGMGSLYWPGYGENDAFSLTTREGSGATVTLKVTNSSLFDRIRYAWKLTDDAGGGGALTRTTYWTPGTSGLCLVPQGNSVVVGTDLIAGSCGAEYNRSSKDVTSKVNGQLGMKWLCVAPAGTPAVGTGVGLSTCADDGTQSWTHRTSDKAMVHDASGLCLNVRGGTPVSGAKLELSTCSASAAQEWSRK